ncbi:MAG: nucleoside kinase [Lentihominibacter sp.]|uniref:nucleoside kinase n=1 Tax=Lentihominibacter sp. TaxID=2944216 RepID=UPI002A920849|nr:nucleoside kinase [Lentihominibacter sp.]MDY5286803.1 nucleoside kinase [Lentihominibacter sp.]
MKIKLQPQIGAAYEEITMDRPVTVKELADRYQPKLPYTVLLANVDGKDEELTYLLDRDCVVRLLDMRTYSANLVYQHSLSLIYLKAVMDVLGDLSVEIENSLNKGLYTEIKTPEPITEEQIAAVEQRMHELVKADLPIVREVYSRQEAIEIWGSYNYPEKSRLLEHAEDVETAKFYTLEGYRNFFYGLMTPSTGYVEHFELRKYRRGVLLRFPHPSHPDRIPAFEDDKKLYGAFGEANKWQHLLDILYLEDLNEKIRHGEAKDLILLSEALHEKKIAEIADRITKEKRRIILIAGPSSSGKTTFARRLCVQLRVNGLQPLYMGTDDYFVERCDTPLGEDGKPNYENLDALDIDLFNDNMNRLLAGEKVDLPEFDFLEGKKKYGRRITSIRSNQPIVIEGIHALNDILTEKIDEEQKFRIYISPFTQLNIDVHNRVPTTDARMLRRIVRDYKFRGHSAAQTIALWPKVRTGEDVNIFPYNGRADVLFNSALVYELSVLKKYAQPLLEAVGPEEEEYSEAVRMLKFIRFFDVIDEEQYIPNNSIMREFIGGSVFVE